jgi:hypothetical protein
LLRRVAEIDLEVFLTTDENLQYQQNLALSAIGGHCSGGTKQHPDSSEPLAASLLAAIPEARPGEFAA